MDKWTELRTAYLVAKLGTVSAAADALHTHRATVNRHIDALEESLGVKLFQRHARGYTPTDAGRDLLETAGRAEEMFIGLAGRAQSRSSQLSGELIISALPSVAPLIMSAMAQLRAAYPEVALHFVAERRLAMLEYGEAHIALRAGQKPVEPDYVVLPFKSVHFSLYAHKKYIERYGKPQSIDDLSGHFLVGSTKGEGREPYVKWMRANVSPTALALHTENPSVILQGVLAGLGLGFLTEQDAAKHDSLVCVAPTCELWSANLWIVTHGDLHRTAKVQEFIRLLKAC